MRFKASATGEVQILDDNGILQSVFPSTYIPKQRGNHITIFDTDDKKMKLKLLFSECYDEVGVSLGHTAAIVLAELSENYFTDRDNLAIADVQTTVDAIEDILDGTTAATSAYKRQSGKTQTFTKALTTATTAGTADVTLATITSKPCHIKSIIIRQNAVAVAELTSIAILGGASKVVTFISAATGVKANLANIDYQLSWDGDVLLGATKTIVATIVGSGASAAQDLTVEIEYYATVDGGYLA